MRTCFDNFTRVAGNREATLRGCVRELLPGCFVGEGAAGESNERRLVASCLCTECLPGGGVDVEVA